MNTSMMHSSGALVLDITDLRLMDRDRATAVAAAAAATNGQDDYVGGGGYDSPPRANADDDDDDTTGADHGGAAMQTDARGPLPGNDATGRWSLGTAKAPRGSPLRPSALTRRMAGAPPGREQALASSSTATWDACQPVSTRSVEALPIDVDLLPGPHVLTPGFGAHITTEPDRLRRPVGDAGSACGHRQPGAALPQRCVSRKRQRGSGRRTTDSHRSSWPSGTMQARRIGSRRSQRRPSKACRCRCCRSRSF